MLRAFFAMVFNALPNSGWPLASHALDWPSIKILKMRRHVVTQASRRISAAAGHRLPQRCDLADQQIDLLLLTNHNRIELFEQVFGEAGLDFQRVEALLNALQVMRRVTDLKMTGAFGRRVVFHAAIGPELPDLPAMCRPGS